MASRHPIQYDSQAYWTLTPTAYDVLRRYLNQRHESGSRTAEPTAAAAASNDWTSRAACLESDSDLFFPVASLGPALRQTAQAKAVCAQCPVRIDPEIRAQAPVLQGGVRPEPSVRTAEI
jgi:hypothetical protein